MRVVCMRYPNRHAGSLGHGCNDAAKQQDVGMDCVVATADEAPIEPQGKRCRRTQVAVLNDIPISTKGTREAPLAAVEETKLRLPAAVPKRRENL